VYPAGKCFFNVVPGGGNLNMDYRSHEPREDLPIVGVAVIGGDFSGYQVFVCKHCGCLCWPHDEGDPNDPVAKKGQT
jgi:hypothetical protein